MSLDLKESSKVNLDIKTLVGIVMGLLTLAGIWFSLTAELAQLKIQVLRMESDVELNHEFRVKWPRGELGALPDDAEQNLKLEYIQRDVDELKAVVKQLELKNAE
jgi:cell division protein FtsB